MYVGVISSDEKTSRHKAPNSMKVCELISIDGKTSRHKSPNSMNVVIWLLNYNQNLPHPPGPTSPRGQGSHTTPGQTLVNPDQLVPSPPKGITPAWDRQRSVPGQLAPLVQEDQPIRGPNASTVQTKIDPRSTGPPNHRVASSPRVDQSQNSS